MSAPQHDSYDSTRSLDPLDWLQDEVQPEIAWSDDDERSLDDYLEMFLEDTAQRSRTWVRQLEVVHEDEAFVLQRTREGLRVHLLAPPAEAAMAFWRAAVRDPQFYCSLQPDGALVSWGAMAVVFRDGSWDALRDYRPDETERAFWTEVARRYAELPGWLLR